jgi:CMP-N,N'-diacetyllegionaminic acid synthase
VLSSDDHEIMDAARAAGCDVPFCRPAHLASDVATSIDVVLHALDQLPGYEYVVLLQPTSPLRIAADIDAAFELMLEKWSAKLRVSHVKWSSLLTGCTE